MSKDLNKATENTVNLTASPLKGTVLLDIDCRGLATITLNRPEKRNAFDSRLIYLLQEKLDLINANKNVRAVLLRSSGVSFSAGADLNWMAESAKFSFDENVEDAECLAKVLNDLNNLALPTIACVQGSVFGGAVGLLACCDIVVATNICEFALSEVKIGLVPAVISPYVVRAISERQARRYFLTAERFNAETAKALGLVTCTVDPSSLDEKVNYFIDCVLANAPSAMTEAKKLVLNIAGKQIDDSLIHETSQLIARIRTSSEGQEGLNAFLEKRRPAWLPNGNSSDV